MNLPQWYFWAAVSTHDSKQLAAGTTPIVFDGLPLGSKWLPDAQ